MLLSQLIKEGAGLLSSQYPEREAKEIVFALLEHKLGTKRHTHIVDPGYEVAEESVACIKTSFERLRAGEPLQYVTGYADFYGRSFKVTPDVLIPRPETELLVREVISRCKDSDVSVLDMCTGSGCIAWTLALEMPGSKVAAVDISDGALKVASSQNFIEEACLSGVVAPKFLKADVLEDPLISAEEESGRGLQYQGFDIIVSNPPYVMDKEKALMRPNVLDHEPHLALFVSDEDPLVFYRAVADWSRKLMKPGGFGFVEINEALGRDTAEVFVEAGFTGVEIVKDLSDRDRFVHFMRKITEN